MHYPVKHSIRLQFKNSSIFVLVFFFCTVSSLCQWAVFEGKFESGLGDEMEREFEEGL